MKKKNASKTAALFGILAAEAIAVSFLEGLLPSFVPIPGAKPGFSNIITMFCVSSLGFSFGLAVTLFKAFFALITRGGTAAFLSLSGGLLSLAVMTLLFRFGKTKFGYIGIGLLSAVAHNAGQLLAAVVLLGTNAFALSPYLLAMSIVTGTLTGTVLKYTMPVLEKQTYFWKTTGVKKR